MPKSENSQQLIITEAYQLSDAFIEERNNATRYHNKFKVLKPENAEKLSELLREHKFASEGKDRKKLVKYGFQAIGLGPVYTNQLVNNK